MQKRPRHACDGSRESVVGSSAGPSFDVDLKNGNKFPFSTATLLLYGARFTPARSMLRKKVHIVHTQQRCLTLNDYARPMNESYVAREGIENENAVKELNKHCVLTWSTLSALSKAHIKGMPWKVTVCIRWIIKTICQTRVLPTTELVLNMDYSYCERDRIACNCCTE